MSRHTIHTTLGNETRDWTLPEILRYCVRTGHTVVLPRVDVLTCQRIWDTNRRYGSPCECHSVDRVMTVTPIPGMVMHGRRRVDPPCKAWIAWPDWLPAGVLRDLHRLTKGTLVDLRGVRG